MIPLPQIIAEFVMALGGALLAANAWALLRPRLRPDAPDTPKPPQAKGKILVNAFIGLIVLVWGLASFLNPS